MEEERESAAGEGGRLGERRCRVRHKERRKERVKWDAAGRESMDDSKSCARQGNGGREIKKEGERKREREKAKEKARPGRRYSHRRTLLMISAHASAVPRFSGREEGRFRCCAPSHPVDFEYRTSAQATGSEVDIEELTSPNYYVRRRERERERESRREKMEPG
jgi:hypothetical protein